MTLHKVELRIEAYPPLSATEPAKNLSTLPLFFEAVGKAISNLDDKGIGIIENHNCRLTARLDKMTPDMSGETMEILVQIEMPDNDPL